MEGVWNYTEAALKRTGRVVAVIVTRDRPALLRLCLDALEGQRRRPDRILVVDNASGAETRAVLAGYAGVRCLRLGQNLGGAGGFSAGLAAALRDGADWVWAMDDDGRPEDDSCLERLLDTSGQTGAELVGALVVDVDRRDRLAFPIRLGGRTVFGAAEVEEHGPVRGFVHLFNGALIGRTLLERIGLPDVRLFIRGDEVEFLFRARRAGSVVVLETGARFLHPSSSAEIHPILGGRYHAVLPVGAMKQYYQFRNRGYIFRRYGMWGWLAADVIRYGSFFLISRGWDVAGFRAWAGATWRGMAGRLIAFEAETETGAAVRAPALQRAARRA